MEWGMIMAMFSVGGMLVLIFAQPETESIRPLAAKS
jgi:hypothetical protein